MFLELPAIKRGYKRHSTAFNGGVEMKQNIFFVLLRTARKLKVANFDELQRRLFLLGMVAMYYSFSQTIRDGENIQDFWKHLGVAD